MKILDRIALLAILVGCAVMLYGLTGCTTTREPADSPSVQLVMWPGQAEDSLLLDGSRAWHELGFEVTWAHVEGDHYVNRVREVECPQHWYTLGLGRDDCQITIGVRTVDLQSMGFKSSTAGVADRPGRVIMLDTEHTREDFYRVAVMAHEAGHILLDTGHLPEGQEGIMSGGYLTWEPTQADYDLACRSIGICLDINDL